MTGPGNCQKYQSSEVIFGRSQAYGDIGIILSILNSAKIVKFDFFFHFLCSVS